MPKTKAIALCRVSTSKQRLLGASLEAQEVRVYECAAYLNTVIEKLWSLDTSSRKGKNVARKDLKEMLAFCKKNKLIKYIIVDEADRFMRSLEEAYWWKQEFKQIGVSLAYAKMPEITHEDNPMAVMREMMALFQAEASNHERITKGKSSMASKIQAGYYPGMVHQGYKKSDTKGLHIPKEPQWSLLKKAMGSVLYNHASLDDALTWLNNNGYRLQGGGMLDMFKLKRIFREPYYAGVIRVKTMDVVCETGLHKSMITIDEHERLLEIVSGKKKKFKKQQYNPAFKASNIIECSDCTNEGSKQCRLVGYRHHNNKPERTRRWYERYRCRGCGKNVLKDVLHDGLDEVFNKTELIDDDGRFLAALRKAWRSSVDESMQSLSRLKQRKTSLTLEKAALVRTLAANPELVDDIRESIDVIKSEIDTTENELEKLSQVETDFDRFVDFATGYVEDLRKNWWAIEDAHDRIRLKQLVYPDGLKISREGKVLTPTLSPIYRYKTSKKTLESVNFALNISYGGPAGT